MTALADLRSVLAGPRIQVRCLDCPPADVTQALLCANGYDMDMGYGGEDRALGERLANLGLRAVQIRHRAPCLHLHHERPYVDRQVIEENRRRREGIRRQRRTRAELGIAELSTGPGRDAESGRGRFTT